MGILYHNTLCFSTIFDSFYKIDTYSYNIIQLPFHLCLIIKKSCIIQCNFFKHLSFLISKQLLSIMSKRILIYSKENGIEHYIDNLYSEYEVKSIKKYSNHKLVNAIINRYAKVCAVSEIAFNCDIRNIVFSLSPAMI